MRSQAPRPIDDLPPRRLLLTAILPATALVLSACSDDDDGHGSMMSSNRRGTSAADHNQADVMFSMMMIPHHAQAVEMADLVPSRSQDAGLTALARQIKAAQQPEIDRMRRWLEDWGQHPPMEDGHADRMGGMNGMMSEADLEELGSAAGATFERRWLEMMVEHHKGAITMAKSVEAAGIHAGTRALAESIVTSQQAEIDTMRKMLAG
jgi:uncharacterized protein (DUF305 family)